MKKGLTVIQSQLKAYDIQEAVLAEFKNAELFKCEDASSRKTLGKFRSNAKALRAKIEQARLDKNREATTKNNDAAKAISEKLTSSIDAYDAEIKPYDEDLKEKANSKKKAESNRIEKVNSLLSSLKDLCLTAMSYGISSEDIKFRISMIEMFDVDDDFQELKSRAEMAKITGLASAKSALKSRKEWEEQQAEVSRIAAEQAAEAKKLANARLKFEADQAEIKAEADRIATIEAAAARKRQEELDAREAVVAEQERVAKAEKERLEAEELERQIAHEKERVEFEIKEWSKDHVSFDTAWNMAWGPIVATAYDEATEEYLKWAEDEKAEAEKEAARIESLRPDREKIEEFAANLAAFEFPEMSTPEATVFLGLFKNKFLNMIVEFSESAKNNL